VSDRQAWRNVVGQFHNGTGATVFPAFEPGVFFARDASINLFKFTAVAQEILNVFVQLLLALICWRLLLVAHTRHSLLMHKMYRYCIGCESS